MNRYIIANWKMNPDTSAIAKRILVGTKKATAKVKNVEVIVCPPVLFLPLLSKELKATKVKLGVQDMSSHDRGAYTGQIAVSMLREYKTRYAVLGHSERRALGESNDEVAEKCALAIQNGLTAVLCVGEAQRTDDGAYYTFVADEIRAVCSKLKRKDLANLMIAYEPIWAIGKSADDVMTTEALYEMVLFIKKILTEAFGRTPAAQIPILYGGAVKASNARALMGQGGVNGLLVGSASLDTKEFTNIIVAVAAQ